MLSRRVGAIALVVLAACSGEEPPADPLSGGALLIRQDVEPRGDNCGAGGTAVRVGLDTNGSDVLEDSEVLKTSYYCGVVPAPVVTRSSPLAAGAPCVAGGTRIEAGPDASGDGVLQDDEVATAEDVCASAAPVLSAVLPEAAGVACPLGGDEVRAGVDTDLDGELAPAEVTQVTHVCRDRAISGFLVEDEADAALLLQVAVVKGDVIVESPTLTEVTIPTDRILGSVIVRRCEALQRISLEDSTNPWSGAFVTGSLVVIDNSSPATIVFPCSSDLGYLCSSRIAGDLVVARNATMAGLFSYLGGLAEVGGSVDIEANPLLEFLRPSDLYRVGGDFRIANNPSLDLGWVSVGAETIGGAVILEGPGGDEVSLPSLLVAGGLEVRGMVEGGILVERLRVLTGSLIVEENAGAIVVAPLLDTVMGDVTFQGNTAYSHFGAFQRLGRVDGDVTFVGNAALEDLRLPALVAANGFRVEANPRLTDLGGPTGTSLASLRQVVDLTIRDNPALAHLTLPSLVAAGNVTVENSPLLPTCEAGLLPGTWSLAVSGTDDLATCP